MRPVFNVTPHLQFSMSGAFPDNFKGIRLAGSAVTTAYHPTIGTIILQEITNKQFNMVFTIFELRELCSLPAVQESCLLTSFLALQNSLHYHFKETEATILQQGQFALLHSNEQEARIYFHEAGNYQSLEISWSKKMMEDFVPSFSFLRPLQEEKNLRRSFYLTPYSKPAGFRSLGMAHVLMRFPCNEPNTIYLFEHKVKEYLLCLLIAAEKIPNSTAHINNVDLNKIQLLYQQLQEHPAKRFPISVLAREANMSEQKLKKLFTQVFGISIFECHLQTRMKQAHRLLEETVYSTAEIAAMVGYQLTTSFITKFREFFGYPPSEVRKGN